MEIDNPHSASPLDCEDRSDGFSSVREIRRRSKVTFHLNSPNGYIVWWRHIPTPFSTSTDKYLNRGLEALGIRRIQRLIVGFFQPTCTRVQSVETNDYIFPTPNTQYSFGAASVVSSEKLI